ncbi:hypothetical protein ACFLTA_07570 [Bacteroidota bacterium]
MNTKWFFQFFSTGPLSRTLIILTLLFSLSQYTSAVQSNESAKYKGSNILLVVGDENGTSEPGKGIGDVFTIARLKDVLGHNVILGFDHDPADKLQKAAAEADLVIVAESVSSAKLLTKLKMVETPIINYEGHIQDDMGFTALVPAGDPGEPSECAYGVRDLETKISIVDPGHPLAAGFKGDVKVYTEPKQITWGTVAISADVIAILPGDKRGATLYVYPKGAILIDGTKAAGLRVGFFLEDDDETGTANLMTEDGLHLFDEAVKFALDAGN